MSANTTTTIPILTEAQVTHLEGPVSINAASCGAQGVASMSRALGCRVAPDRQTVTVFLAAPYAEALLRDLRAERAIAVVFSQPSTHITLQIKAASARVEPLMPGDPERIQTCARRFIEDIRKLGYTEPFAKAMMAAVSAETVAVTFTPTAIFDQTPGPAAGRRVEISS